MKKKKNYQNYQKINFLKFLLILPFLAIIISIANIIFIDDIYVRLMVFFVLGGFIFVISNTNVNPPFRGFKIIGLTIDGEWVVWRTRNVILLSVQTIQFLFVLDNNSLEYSSQVFIPILIACILLAILLYQRFYNFNLDRLIANFTIGTIVYRVFTTGTEMMWIPIVSFLIFVTGLWLAFKEEKKKYN